MTNNFLNKKLCDFYNISEFVPKSLTLKEKDYKTIIDRKSKDILYSFLIEGLPKKNVPEKFLRVATLINSYYNSQNFLLSYVDFPVQLQNGIVYKDRISLFKLITEYGKFPITKNLSNRDIDLSTEVDNYFKFSILIRFFFKKGIVFYSELLKISGVSMVTTDVFTQTKVNYYDKLIEEKIIRKSYPNELPLILKFQTKQQLIELISKLLNKEKTTRLKLKSLNKTELILLISDKKEITEIGLTENFYLLDDIVQEYKNWLVKEKPYINLYELFQLNFSDSGYEIARMMKDLIRINNDYETAFKLGTLFYRHLEQFKEMNMDFNYAPARVATQMERIKKHYDNEVDFIIVPNLKTIIQ